MALSVEGEFDLLDEASVVGEVLDIRFTMGAADGGEIGDVGEICGHECGEVVPVLPALTGISGKGLSLRGLCRGERVGVGERNGASAGEFETVVLEESTDGFIFADVFFLGFDFLGSFAGAFADGGFVLESFLFDGCDDFR